MLYVHFTLVVGIVWTAFGIRYIVSSAQDIAFSCDDELLMCGFVSLCLFSIEVIPFAIARASYDDDDAGDSPCRKKEHIIRGSVYRFIAGSVIILIPY